MEKVGTKVSRAKFREELRLTMMKDSLPEYRLALDTRAKPDDVVFYSRNSGKLAKQLIAQSLSAWFSILERLDNRPIKQPAIGDV